MHAIIAPGINKYNTVRISTDRTMHHGTRRRSDDRWADVHHTRHHNSRATAVWYWYGRRGAIYPWSSPVRGAQQPPYRGPWPAGFRRPPRRPNRQQQTTDPVMANVVLSGGAKPSILHDDG